MALTPPRGYELECGPEAVAAIAGVSPDHAARVLWGMRFGLRGDDPAAHVTASPGSAWGTWSDVVASAAMRYGFGLEQWTGSGELVASADQLRRAYASLAHERALTVRRVANGDRPRSGSAGPRSLTVSGWRRKAGTWLVFVNAHVLVLKDGQVLSGGDGYGRHRVRVAFRIVQPGAKTC